MWNLSNMRLFALLSKSSQEVTNEEMQNAYEKFIAGINTISQETDFTSIIRKLNITRIELLSLLKQNQYEQGGKCA